MQTGGAEVRVELAGTSLMPGVAPDPGCTMSEPGCRAGSVAGRGLAVLAAVLQQPEDAEVAAAAEREQRHLDGEEGSRFRPAGELDRGALPVLEDAVEELAELGQVGGVDAGDGRGEQLLAGVAEQRAARAVGGQDLVAEGVDDECRIAGFLEELPEMVIVMHRWPSPSPRRAMASPQSNRRGRRGGRAAAGGAAGGPVTGSRAALRGRGRNGT